MLDAVVNFLPSPVDISDPKGINPDSGEDETRKARDDESFSGLLFKDHDRSFCRKIKLCQDLFRKLESRNTGINTTTDNKERVSKIIELHANTRIEMDEAFCGDIVGIVGLKNVKTGDTLCAPAKPIKYETIIFPDPVISVAIEPKTKSDQEKLGVALNKIAEEDPTFKITTDSDSGQTIISGMGELHLEIIVDRMLREFKVDASVGKPPGRIQGDHYP